MKIRGIIIIIFSDIVSYTYNNIKQFDDDDNDNGTYNNDVHEY